MIKYFHELTQAQVDALCDTYGYTWAQCAEEYPQPEWCGHPRAVNPIGCAALVQLKVTGANKGRCVQCQHRKAS
ncbi:MAG: hypothetical protein UY48_C0005G0025 [Candidatus Gottesmanbacteria bacterium GW2011_GWB1_49_7]|uniref:Uncharacterized protein n=1 Tax=Candidatus Gottesmanbacteria bacterium GW2011_GWB1_49_7 TaxID=1618448 RepID=A0A0G1Z2R4_9BACT|nr:MAG: hypothetical protein UY48_C0005G0025 [Candidatus Gottesmanbacteria bacterium GW2011_GWB1_49_7]